MGRGFNHILLFFIALLSAMSAFASPQASFTNMRANLVYNPTPSATGWGSDLLAGTLGRTIYYNGQRAAIQTQLQQGIATTTPEFFTAAENARFVTQTMAQLDRDIGTGLGIIGRGTLRTAVNNFYAKLVDHVVPRVFSRKVFPGDAAQATNRANAWKVVLKNQMNRCVSAPDENSQYIINCLQQAMSGNPSPFMINIGLAVVADITDVSLAPMASEGRELFSACRSSEYLQCMSVTLSNAPSGCGASTYPLPANRELVACSMRAMRNGIMKIAPPLIRREIERLAPANQVTRINQLAVNSLRTCVQTKSSEAEIQTCIDRVVILVGEEIAESQIQNHQVMQTTFTTPQLRQTAISEARQTFRQCAQRAQQNGQRVNKVLQVESCTSEVEHRIARLALNATLRTQDAQAAGVGIEAVDRCWPGNQASDARVNACLRQGILTYASAAGRTQISANIPAGLLASRPGIIDTHVGALEACLQESLPTDIMKATDIMQSSDGCVQQLTQDVARASARFEVSQKLSSQIPPSELEPILQREVDENFITCLGEAPTSEVINRCKQELTHSVGRIAGELLIPRSIGAHIQNSGGVEAYGLTNESLQQLTDGLVAQNAQCLEQNLATIETSLNSCFSQTIIQATGDIGVLQVRQQIAQLGNSGQNLDMATIEARTRESLTACMREAGEDLEALATKTTECSTRVTAEIRRMVAGQFIDLSRAAIDLIFNNYSACIAAIPANASNNRRRQATTRCREAMQAAVASFLAPFREMTRSRCNQNEGGLGIEVNMLDLAAAGIVALIQEGHADPQTRQEVWELIDQIGNLVSGDSPDEARLALINDSSTDEVLRSVINGVLGEAINAIPEDVNISRRARRELVDEELLNGIFTSEVLQDVKAAAATLIQGAASGQGNLSVNGAELQMAVARAYLDSDQVRTTLLQSQIDAQTRRQLGPFNFLAPLVGGIMGMNFNWSKVRETEAGRAAEQWVVDQVIFPMIRGELSPEASAELQREAARRMQAAMQGN